MLDSNVIYKYYYKTTIENNVLYKQVLQEATKKLIRDSIAIIPPKERLKWLLRKQLIYDS